MNQYKRPESVLVVIYCSESGRVLMLQRQDEPLFWQSVTGSLEGNEIPEETAIREVWEETGIDIKSENLTLIDAQHQIEFDIYSYFLHRYALGVTRNIEHWFYLPLAKERDVVLTEHLAYQWLELHLAADLTISLNNRDAIERIIRNELIK